VFTARVRDLIGEWLMG